MNCPKCQGEMGNYEVSEHDYVVCENKACEYWGILRLDLEEFEADDEEGSEETPVQQSIPQSAAQPAPQQPGIIQ